MSNAQPDPTLARLERNLTFYDDDAERSHWLFVIFKTLSMLARRRGPRIRTGGEPGPDLPAVRAADAGHALTVD
jgi:hypothetical protein